jgi:hypothetical protein
MLKLNLISEQANQFLIEEETSHEKRLAAVIVDRGAAELRSPSGVRP